MEQAEPSNPARDEREVIERILRGASDEYRALVERFQNQIFRLIVRQVGDETIARDLAQETFIRAYEKLGSFQFRSSFSTWITRIALNHTNNYFASRAFKQRARETPMTAHQANSVTSENDPSANTEEQLRELQWAIGQLRPKFREVIVLCGIEEKSYEEVAEILQIPVGTVRSRLHSARQTVRGLLFGGSGRSA